MRWEDYMKKVCGYECKTTYWDDFTIAETFGKNGVLDTYRRAKKLYFDDIEFITEIAMVLNHKIWYWADHEDELAHLYDQLWKELDAEILEKKKGEELSYYLRTTD